MESMTTQKPFACNASGCGKSFTNEDHLTVHEKKHEMILSLGLEPKMNIFAVDQTPTPTRLIKNCEEVGLFDELRNVNPFDETFRRAVEQNNQSDTISTSCLEQQATSAASQDSLHTPQVFPRLLEASSENYKICQPIEPVVSTPNIVISEENCNTDIESSETLSSLFKHRQDKPEKTRNSVKNLSSHATLATTAATFEFVQPPVITLSFPTTVPHTSIPIQTVKPFILPKLKPHANVTTLDPVTPAPADRSSASLTPTSQLPIKERLKSILGNNSKTKTNQTSIKSIVRGKKNSKKKYDDDCMERRRAAATRYRNKQKNEYQNLRRKNEELQKENRKLLILVEELQAALKQYRNDKSHQHFVEDKSIIPTMSNQIQIPPSTVRLVMNIPEIIVQPSGQTIIKDPVSFAVEKT